MDWGKVMFFVGERGRKFFKELDNVYVEVVGMYIDLFLKVRFFVWWWFNLEVDVERK